MRLDNPEEPLPERHDQMLQSPEGDWADCDVALRAVAERFLLKQVAIPRRGLG